MTTPNENDVQGDTTTQETEPVVSTDESVSQPQESDIYAPYLERFPESLHTVARDVFKEWDGQVTKKIQSVHEEYQPYKPFVEQYEPDAIQQAITIAEAMERDPQQFIDAIANAYGITPSQAMQAIDDSQQQTQTLPELDPDDPYAARLTQHEELLRTMAESLLSERQMRDEMTVMQQQEEDYANTMQELTTKYGEFDVDYVNVLLAQGVEPEAAVEHWQSQVQTFAQKQLTPNQTAPTVMSAGGGTPSIQQDVETLSSQDTRKLVENILRQASEGSP